MVIKMKKYDVYSDDVCIASIEIPDSVDPNEYVSEIFKNKERLTVIESDGNSTIGLQHNNQNAKDIELDIMTDRDGNDFKEIASFVDRVREENNGLTDDEIYLHRCEERSDHEMTALVVPKTVNNK